MKLYGDFKENVSTKTIIPVDYIICGINLKPFNMY